MISIDATSPVPPFEQVRSQISDQIRSGDLHPGQRLPSIRQLAADLRVAPGTVARAYSGLETAGLIQTNRSSGTRVLASQTVDRELHDAALAVVALARRKALPLADILGAVRSEWARTVQP